MQKQESWVKIIDLLAELVVFESYDFEQFLKKLMKVTLNIIPVNSCLVYFYDREEKDLILIASKKPHEKLMGKLSMKEGEGITGWVATHGKVVVLKKEAYKDPRFKSFEELPEDTFEAFLSVPIVDKEGVVGVMNLQNKDAYNFSKEQVKAIEAIVKIVSSAFEKIVLQRKVGRLEDKLEERIIIEKAKGVLMKKQKLSEHAAYELIRQESMKKRKSMREMAEAVLLVY